MFLKLVKYEFKTVNKWYLGLYGSIITLSLIIGLWIRGGLEKNDFWTAMFNETSELYGTHTYPYESGSTSVLPEVFGMIVTIAFFSLFVALGISTLFLIIRRFKNSVYDREGYLTLTLPVTKHEIILSKLTAAFIWTILSVLTLLISVALIGFIISFDHVNWEQLFHIRALDWISIVQGFLFFVLSTTSSILLIYLAISIGQLFNDNRVIFGFMAYVGISIVMTTLSLLISANFNIGESLFVSYSIAQDLILSILYYFGTYYILKNKVNLQ
ncbi:ABC-2 transporter permease [Streptococcus himalayensis]|uniref:Membrane protein n=1 Tax=Streptococcus himalayensis TaxID=1888195 RepID=A0A917A6B1_9STRE|nr:ABC-2 transporter permease [Streptococcus himalayensis]GGE30165.1 membrane protein [Streptococcus himalayensis]